jgi:hypothetical protein
MGRRAGARRDARQVRAGELRARRVELIYDQLRRGDFSPVRQ